MHRSLSLKRKQQTKKLNLTFTSNFLPLLFCLLLFSSGFLQYVSTFLISILYFPLMLQTLHSRDKCHHVAKNVINIPMFTHSKSTFQFIILDFLCTWIYLFHLWSFFSWTSVFKCNILVKSAVLLQKVNLSCCPREFFF